MKRIFLLCLGMALGMLVHAEKFYIPHYRVEIKVQKNGELLVKEIIQADFTQEAHGIIRQIVTGSEPIGEQGMAMRLRGMGIGLSDILVSEAPFQVDDSQKDKVSIKIGSSSLMVNGPQTYTLTYKAQYAINHFADHSEFYWNLIGQQWATRIDQVEFSIQLPTGLTVTQEDIRIYTGPLGSKDSNAIVQSGPGWIRGKTTQPLPSFHGLTLAFRVPASYFSRTELPQLLSGGTGNMVQKAKGHYRILPNGDCEINETLTLHTQSMTRLERHFPVSDVPLHFEKMRVQSTPALLHYSSQNKLILHTPTSQALNGTYQIQLQYTLKGLFEPTQLAVRHLELPAPLFKDLQAAMDCDIVLEMPSHFSNISDDSLKAKWLGAARWNLDKAPTRTGNTWHFHLQHQPANTQPLKMVLDFPALALPVPDLPAAFYSPEYMFGTYHLALSLQPDGYLTQSHQFSIEAVKPQTTVSTAGIADFRSNENADRLRTDGPPFWGPHTPDWFETGQKIPIQEIKGGNEGAGVFLWGGTFSHIEVPAPTEGEEAAISLQQYGWLSEYGNSISIDIPILASLPQPARRTRVSFTLPAHVDASAAQFYLTRYDFRGNPFGQALPLLREGQQFSARLGSPLRTDQYLILSGTLPASAVAEVPFGNRFSYWASNNASLWKGIGIWAGVFFFLGLIWFFVGRDRKETLVPQFGPPAGITPAEAGLIWDGRLHRKDLMVLLPYWAAQGYMTIQPDADGYWFKQLKALPYSAKDFEKTLFKGLFAKAGSGKRIHSSKLRDNFYLPFLSASLELENWGKLSRIFVPGTRSFGLVLMVAGVIALIIGAVGISIDLKAADIFIESRTYIPIWMAVLGSGMSLFFFGWIMPKRGSLKRKEYAHLLGFREFIKTAEVDRLKVLMEENPHYFDETLPYAIVMGLAKPWTTKFNDWLAVTQSEVSSWVDAKDQPLDWAINRLLHNLNDMHSTMTAVTPSSSGSSSYSSSSSSSSYSSGSSWSSSSGSSSASSGGSSFGGGGGYSGGGFGGGGGSSW